MAEPCAVLPSAVLPQPEHPGRDVGESAAACEPTRRLRLHRCLAAAGLRAGPYSWRTGPAASAGRVVRGLRALKRRVRVRTPVRAGRGRHHRGHRRQWRPRRRAARPATDRWLHLVLAVDAGPSMRVWHDTVSELADALTGSRHLPLRTRGPSGAPVSLIGGRTVVLVVTDGVADHWYTGTAHARLASLARSVPTAVLHVFPLGCGARPRWQPNPRSSARPGLRRPTARFPPTIPGSPPCSVPAPACRCPSSSWTS